MDQTTPLNPTSRSQADAAFCGRVPLHQTNLVQPHGILLVADNEQLRILQCSENAEALFHAPVAEIVSKRLFSYLSTEHAALLQSRLAEAQEGKLPLVLQLNGQPVLFLIEKQEDFFIAEVARARTQPQAFVDIYQDLKYVMAAIDRVQTTVEAAGLVARELKQLSGFDKVMIYRFDKDWNGEVIAEEMEEGMDAYLGLKFPASDIPKQARELYKKNPYRLIPDVNYQPIKLYPVLNPVTHTFTDLSNCNLRSVAAVHLEYLRNMKVVASMSTRILKDGELWGLIACHHRTPRHLSYETCSIFEMLSTIITTKISALDASGMQAYKAQLLLELSHIVAAVYQSRNLADALYAKRQDIMAMLRAEGLVISIDKQLMLFGKTPAEGEIRDLIYWLQSQGHQGTYQQPNLSGVYESALPYAAQASGLLALPVQAEKGDFILAFRPEAVQQVAWGGNPEEAIRFEADRKAYHPRSSFEQWQQTVWNTAIDWESPELETAEKFRHFLIEYRLNHS